MADRHPARTALPALLIGLLVASSARAAGPAEGAKPWAFRPVVRPEVPKVDPQPPNPIDAFLLKSLEEKGLKAAPDADLRTLVRRVYFDLIGLPPTPEEMDAILADDRPGAYERLVDRLLANPHYGERWGRHWLDLVRYAETHGYERDDPKPNAWRYRDWVIDAFNRDIPYDRFITEQLAGDEIPCATKTSKIATGIYRLGLIDDEPADPVTDRFDQLDDMIKTVGTTFLGLTIHCARCHEHKFDPISQTDYYRMLAFFTPGKKYRRGDDGSISVGTASESEEARIAELNRAVDKQAEAIRARLATEKPTDALRQVLEQRIRDLDASRPTIPGMVLGFTDASMTAEPTKLLVRGDAHKPGQEVSPGFLKILDPAQPAIAPAAKTTGRRLTLARWMTRPDNPLTARVMVNRIWMHHFGRGLVNTPSDFGAMGEEPTNPALLDWLASEFVARGWSVKEMHRLILTSQAYRRADTSVPAVVRADPDNATFSRRPPRRLEAEPIRDSVLAISGRLNLTMGGESVRPPIDRAVLAGQSRPGSGWVVSDPIASNRRSVYIYVKRTLLVPELESLDLADVNDPCPRRPITTTAPQALTMLNSAFYHEQAGHFAERLRREVGDDTGKQVDRAFALAFNRKPTDAERVAAMEFLSREAALIAGRPDEASRKVDDALKALCLVILNANETVTVD